MLSNTYQMSSQGDPQALAVDPANNLFWRFDMRRMTAEEIRDSILAVNGTLNLEQGGPGIYPPLPEEVLENVDFDLVRSMDEVMEAVLTGRAASARPAEGPEHGVALPHG